ncbi:MAG TPA: sterol desaturase family protein [Planctomycetota bacterium]|nr:sterol desaturase family protein [Planctomycetota bacterium]
MLEPKSIVASLVLAALWVAESWVPFFSHFQGRLKDRIRHDVRNLALGITNAALLALLLGGVFALVGSWAEEANVGILRALEWPGWIEVVVALVVFDLWMYLWHRANHRIPFLWRFHRMHHSDPEMDATTAVRFHTGEVVLSGLVRLAVIPVLGMELWQLALYETVLLPVIILHHSNVGLPRILDHGLLALFVTPAMHRVHHSRVREETDSNYGSIFPYWDMVFRTFRLRTDARTIHLGLDGLDDPKWQGLKGMLLTPLGPDRPGTKGSRRLERLNQVADSPPRGP